MTLIADLFPKLHTPKNVIRYMSKKSRFKGPFDSEHGKRVQTLLRSDPQNRYQEENTCHQQSMCKQTLIRLSISLEQTFSDSITFKMITKCENGAVVNI